ncbi:MAG: DMT family transporter [Halobacteriota archaeon]
MVSTLGVLLAIAAACFLAGQALAIRVATKHGSAADVLLVVMIVNLVVLAPLAAYFDPYPTLSPRSIASFAAAGVVGTMLGRILFYSGIKRIGASRAEPIKASMPLHATVFAVVFLDEFVTPGQFAGVVLVVGGLALITWDGSTAAVAGRETPWFGLALPLGAAILFALEPIFATIGLREGTGVLVGLTIKSAAAVVVFVTYLAWSRSLPNLREIPIAELRWYVLAGVLSTSFLLAYYAGLSVSRVGIVVPIMQTSPLIVLGFAAIFLRESEQVTIRLLLAVLVVVLGAIVVTVSG